MKKVHLYALMMLLTSLLWAGNFVISKSLIDHGSTITLSALRWLIAVIVLIPMVWKKEKKLTPPKKAIKPLFFMALTGVVLFNVFQFQALNYTSSTNVGLISTLNTVFIAIFSVIFLKEKINLLQVGAIGLSFIGVLVVLTNGNVAELTSLNLNIGDLWMLMASLIWGMYAVFSKHAMNYVSPLMATLYAGVFGVLILTPFAIIEGSFITNIDTAFILSLLYTGVVSTVVCMVLWNLGVQKLGATNAGLFLNFNPIFTAILAMLILGEEITLFQVVGGLIVIIGCFLFTRFNRLEGLKKMRLFES